MMRPWMIAGLALAAGLTAWTAFHDDGDAVEPVRQDARAKSGKDKGASSGPVSKRALADGRASKNAAPANLADVQAFTQGVPQWQSRVALASASLGAAVGQGAL
ncbi:MAG: hypothetical protein EOP36_13430 [Rubrivivax sp.]|nr:MAG: hypothetical protein EOP36_13430 [Rubrivivax sp.]